MEASEEGCTDLGMYRSPKHLFRIPRSKYCRDRHASSEVTLPRYSNSTFLTEVFSHYFLSLVLNVQPPPMAAHVLELAPHKGSESAEDATKSQKQSVPLSGGQCN